MDDIEREAIRAEGLDPDDPEIIAAIDLVRWQLSSAARSSAFQSQPRFSGSRGTSFIGGQANWHTSRADGAQPPGICAECN
jgi:hypothetical protein